MAAQDIDGHPRDEVDGGIETDIIAGVLVCYTRSALRAATCTSAWLTFISQVEIRRNENGRWGLSIRNAERKSNVKGQAHDIEARPDVGRRAWHSDMEVDRTRHCGLQRAMGT